MYSFITYAAPILAQVQHEQPSSTDLLVRGLFAFGLAMLLLVGSIWLLLAMILGGRLAYWLTGAVFFACMVLLSLIWALGSVGLGGSTQKVALGPKGPDTVWHTVGVGPDLGEVELKSVHANSKITGAPQTRSINEMYDVSDYPNGADWKAPAENEYLADLSGTNDTLSERASTQPALRELVSASLSATGREAVQDKIKGTVSLESGGFEIVDIRFREERVDGTESIVAVGRAVPSLRASAQADVPDGTAEEFLVKAGDEITAGTPILISKAEDGTTYQVVSNAAGKVISLAQSKGERVRGGLVVAILDASGQPGAPDPVEVAAVRVRGSLRTPALVYLFGSLVLFAVHMLGLSRAEAAKKAVPQPA